MRTYVALDLETTGLDPERDAVIEIGAVRVQGARVESEWGSLVNPGRPLPPFITQLTGISDEMLANAPRVNRVVPELAEFVGDLPILGHNVGFDLSFLKRFGLFGLNDAIDTYDLASVLLPAAGRYRLASLANSLNVPVPQSHRALDDAHTTHQVFVKLQERVRDLPMALVEEIVRLGAEVDWGGGGIFDGVLRVDMQAESVAVELERLVQVVDGDANVVDLLDQGLAHGLAGHARGDGAAGALLGLPLPHLGGMLLEVVDGGGVDNAPGCLPLGEAVLGESAHGPRRAADAGGRRLQ